MSRNLSLSSAEAPVGALAFTGLDRRHPLQPYQHLIAKIELAASVTITLRHFENDEDFGTGWSATANRDDDNGTSNSRTVGSEWADGPFTVLDRLAAALRVNVEDEVAEAAA